MSTVKSKKCKKCGEIKPLTEFHKKKDAKDGLKYICKSCSKEKRRKRYEKNREYEKERNRKYHQKHREHYKEYYKRYRKENKEYFKEYRRKYYQENMESEKERHKKYKKERYANDPEFRTSCLLREQTRRLGDYKNTNTIELVGCSAKEFWVMNGSPSIEELEDLHIDHIIPLSWFDLSNEGHVKVSNHYLNLQYLNSEDNLEKKDKYAGRPDNILGYKGEFDVDGYVADILEKIKDLNLHL